MSQKGKGVFMALVCDICGKSKSVGRSQTHKRGVAGKRWRKRAPKTKRVFKPNLHDKTVVINGEEEKMKLCAKCIKRIKKFGEIQDYKNISLL